MFRYNHDMMYEMTETNLQNFSYDKMKNIFDKIVSNVDFSKFDEIHILDAPTASVHGKTVVAKTRAIEGDVASMSSNDEIVKCFAEGLQKGLDSLIDNGITKIGTLEASFVHFKFEDQVNKLGMKIRYAEII